MCACERTIASRRSIAIGSLVFFSPTSLRRPWKSPQSSRIVLPSTCTRCAEPVTSRAAPTNWSRIQGPRVDRRSALRFGLAREDDGEPRAVLRHHRRGPAAPAALVEQVRQRILVLALVLGQPHDHGLIFFHAANDSSLS